MVSFQQSLGQNPWIINTSFRECRVFEKYGNKVRVAQDVRARMNKAITRTVS